jgi:hypothetical protein
MPSYVTSALDEPVALESRLAFADVLSGQVATLSVRHAFTRQRGNSTLVNI